MYKLVKYKRDGYGVLTETGDLISADSKDRAVIILRKLGVVESEIEMGINEMELQGHRVVHFGISGLFLHTNVS